MPDSLCRIVLQSPVAVSSPRGAGTLIDFGRVAFGNLFLTPPAGACGKIVVHFGEALCEGRIHRSPPGSVRYARVEVTLASDAPTVVAPPADLRNTTHPSAVRTPAEWGVLLPFRWVEIEGWPGALCGDAIQRRAAFLATWDDQAASFASSEPMLDRIWDLCRYSIKATTFAGVYVDGDRERIAYEADAYLNQLSHYACDHDTQMARATFDRLMRLPTWPTEWASHMIFMAYADWIQTGDRAWLAERYEALKPKLMLDRLREDGLLTSAPAQIERGDLVDWPPGERDGFVCTPVNSVVNAFHFRALTLMTELASAVGRSGEAEKYRAQSEALRATFLRVFYDTSRGEFRDGEGADHASLHANLFPLAFGLVPEKERARFARSLARRGMACSVYAAQYLLESLFENGADREALDLITSTGDRSWRHMVESGTTITWEAWDQKYKPNQDWNHAWGAAPANLISRYILGVQPLRPGWEEILVKPHPGGLAWAEGVVPTPRGPVHVRWENGDIFQLHVSLPPCVSARVEEPTPIR